MLSREQLQVLCITDVTNSQCYFKATPARREFEEIWKEFRHYSKSGNLSGFVFTIEKGILTKRVAPCHYSAMYSENAACSCRHVRHRITLNLERLTADRSPFRMACCFPGRCN